LQGPRRTEINTEQAFTAYSLNRHYPFFMPA